MLFGNRYKLWTSSMYDFLLPPVTSYLLGPNVRSTENTCRRNKINKTCIVRVSVTLRHTGVTIVAV
jgi:hypothetical protein